jgi:hypothetical protein
MTEEEIWQIVKDYDEDYFGRILMPSHRVKKCSKIIGVDYDSLSKRKKRLLKNWLIDCAQGCNKPLHKIKEDLLN